MSMIKMRGGKLKEDSGYISLKLFRKYYIILLLNNFERRIEMDKNIESLLIQILETQTSMKSDIVSIKSDLDTVKSDIVSMKSDIASMKSDISTLTKKVDRNTIVLEKIETDVKTLAEVQSSFSEQLDRSKGKESKSLGERLDIIELAVTSAHGSIKDVSKDIRFIKHKVNETEEDVFDIKDHLKLVQ